MKAFTQEALNEGHRLIDRLIRITTAAQREACEAGEVEARNRLDLGLSHAYAFRSVLGGLKAGGIMPQSGGKD